MTAASFPINIDTRRYGPMSSVRTLLIFVFMAVALTNLFANPDQMSVTVKETQVRQNPSFMGKVLATLAYGDRVEVVEEQRGWAKVVIPGGTGQGWVNLSALTKKRIVMKAGAKDVDRSASGSEVALAGKGFNEEVEEKYKQDKNLDYTWIDRMETFVFPPEQLAVFMTEAGLSLGGAE
jgi:hypothetical protein